ncbi:hypothetical protein BRARA_F00033 [Brassica rapa]|uniref:F-box associated beta-propeller type 1 domain-containing protein n=1 Tax=Brassica campestris TaxID=3711 RepID=A0A397YT61_BRACM|nr:hypothetical protein BRARA_F00033 [Brassica rapa]CAG7867806.1 unnamed protein product [Brassica rapa]VDC64696.1 unnamed protein product [Brassica rapa]
MFNLRRIASSSGSLHHLWKREMRTVVAPFSSYAAEFNPNRKITTPAFVVRSPPAAVKSCVFGKIKPFTGETLDFITREEEKKGVHLTKEDLVDWAKLWLHNINDNNTSSCEVFDFGAKQWRQVNPPRPDHRIEPDREPVFANGWLYWFCQDKTKLVAFDLHMETFRVVRNPSSPSSSVVEMHLGCIDDDRRLIWVSEINKDGMQHVWRLTNHNTGGALVKTGNIMFSFALNKIIWIESIPHPSSHLRLEAVSKKGSNEAMLAVPFSHYLFQFQQPNLLTSISYPSPRPFNSVIRPYFPSFASPL